MSETQSGPIGPDISAEIPDGQVTPAQLEQRRQAPRQHGLKSAFALAGDESALQPAERTRLAELRAELDTRDGRRRVLVERAARLVLIAEWGEEWLREKALADGAVAAFTAPMLARFFTAAAEARRSLESLEKSSAGDEGGDVARILEQLKK